MNAATTERIERIFQNAAWADHCLGAEGMDGISAANLARDLMAVKGAWDELVAENARHGDAIRDILDVCVGWTRTMTDAEKLAAIEKFAREALAGSGGDTTNG